MNNVREEEDTPFKKTKSTSTQSRDEELVSCVEQSACVCVFKTKMFVGVDVSCISIHINSKFIGIDCRSIRVSSRRIIMLISGVHVHCRWLPLAMVSGGRCPAPVMPEPGTHHTACVRPWIILSSESLCPGYLAFATHQWTAPIRGPPVVLSRLTYSALTAAYTLSGASSTEWASVRRAG